MCAAVQPALALGGAQKPARPGPSPGVALLGGQAGQGRGARPPAFTTAEPPLCPTVGPPPWHPAPSHSAWEEQTQSLRPHTEGCLFFICRGIVASIFGFHSLSHKLWEDGHFLRPSSNWLQASPCVRVAVCPEARECLCCQVQEWPAPHPLARRRQRGGRGEKGFTGARKPSSHLGPASCCMPTPVLVRVPAEGPRGLCRALGVASHRWFVLAVAPALHGVGAPGSPPEPPSGSHRLPIPRVVL